jgi:hypothetical protein
MSPIDTGGRQLAKVRLQQGTSLLPLRRAAGAPLQPSLLPEGGGL